MTEEDRMVAVLAPLEADREHLVEVLDHLDVETQPVVRADLAAELVRSCARYEDIKERGLLPTLKDSGQGGSQLGRAEEGERQIRDAMRDVWTRLRHVDPIDVHLSDAEGFERDLGQLVVQARSRLALDDRELFPLAGQLDRNRQSDLSQQLERAVAQASSHVDPPGNPVARFVADVGEKVERVLHDRATPWNPGLDKLERDEGDG